MKKKTKSKIKNTIILAITIFAMYFFIVGSGLHNWSMVIPSAIWLILFSIANIGN